MKSLGRTEENSSSRFLMAVWSGPDILQFGARIPSSCDREFPSSRISGCSDGSLEGNADGGLDGPALPPMSPPTRGHMPNACSASSDCGKKWDVDPKSSINRW